MSDRIQVVAKAPFKRQIKMIEFDKVRKNG